MDDAKLMEKALEDLLYQNRMYASPKEIMDVFGRITPKRKCIEDITINENNTVQIKPDSIYGAKEGFGFILTTIREIYATKVDVEDATYLIGSALNNWLVKLNEAGASLPPWITPIRLPNKTMGKLYEEEKIDLICMIYSEIVQNIVSSLPADFQVETLSKLTKDFFKNHPEL